MPGRTGEGAGERGPWYGLRRSSCRCPCLRGWCGALRWVCGLPMSPYNPCWGLLAGTCCLSWSPWFFVILLWSWSMIVSARRFWTVAFK